MAIKHSPGCGCCGCKSIDVPLIESTDERWVWQSEKPLKLDLWAEVRPRTTHTSTNATWFLKDHELTLQLFSLDGETETIEFTRTFSVELFIDDPSLTELPSFLQQIQPGLRLARMISDGTGGPLNNGYLYYDIDTDRFFNLPAFAITSFTFALTARPSYVNLQNSVKDDVRDRALQAPTEFRLATDLSTKLYLRVISTAPDSIQSIVFTEIENATRSRSESCLRRETCQFSPQKNSPQWAFESADAGNGSLISIAEISHDLTAHSGCRSRFDRQVLERPATITVTSHQSMVRYRAVYESGYKGYEVDHHRCRIISDATPSVPTPTYWINPAISVTAEDETDCEITGTAVLCLPRLNPDFGLQHNGAITLGGTKYLVNDSARGWYMDTAQAIFTQVYIIAPSEYPDLSQYNFTDVSEQYQMTRTQVATLGWDETQFGAKPPPPTVPANHLGSPLVEIEELEVSVTLLTTIRLDTPAARNVLMLGRQLDQTLAANVTWRKSVPKWDGLVPPIVSFAEGDILTPVEDEDRIYEAIRSIRGSDTDIQTVPIVATPNDWLQFTAEYTSASLSDFEIEYVAASDAIEIA